MVTVDLNNEDESTILKALENKPDSPLLDFTDENGTIHIIDDMDTKEDTELARAIQNSLDQSKASDNNNSTTIPTNPDDLILRPTWTLEGDHEKFPSGVGLKNIGNTCYVNALLQSYFMIPSVLKSVMRTKSAQKSNSSPEDVHMTEANQTQDASLAHLDEESSVEFLQSLQKLFASMLLTNTNFVDPSSVMQKLKDAENKPYKIGEMQDLPEFNSLFLSRLEKGMETLHKESRENISAKFKELFYGKTAVFVEAEELDHTKIEKKTIDTFNHLILPISQDTRNYMDAFELCMKDDMIEYTTDKSHKTKARKTMWFDGKESIPPVLFLQTSRAVYGTNTLTKIQNSIDLPFDLNLGPYLLENRDITEGIRSKLKVLNQELEHIDRSLKTFLESYENREFGLIQAFEVCSNRLFEIRHEYEEQLSSSNANNIDHFSIAIQILQQQQEHMTRRVSELKEKRDSLLHQIEKAWEVKYPQELSYNLYSIIMHSGSSALGGHYWSYIKYQGDDNTWFKFNDTIVTTLTKEDVIREAFKTKSSSAYCLIYIDPSKTGKFDLSFKDEILTEIPQQVLADIEKKNHDILRKFKPEILQEMKKNFSVKDLLKDDMTNRIHLAHSDMENSSLEHDYRLRNFLAFLQCLIKTAPDAAKNELNAIFCAQVLNEGSEAMFAQPFYKNPENEKTVEELIDEQPVTELAKKLIEGKSKLYTEIKADYKTYRTARLAINRALTAITNSTFTDAINYLAYSISESRNIKGKVIQEEMIKEAQSVLNICCASLLSEMLSFLQFETGEPSKQIVNFCVKCAADFGSVELCKYLLEKCDLINQQFDGCLKTYNVWIEDLKKRLRNDRIIGTNFHIDRKSIHISPQDDESYYEAEIEESKRNYPQFLSLQAAYASDFK